MPRDSWVPNQTLLGAPTFTDQIAACDATTRDPLHFRTLVERLLGRWKGGGRQFRPSALVNVATSRA